MLTSACKQLCICLHLRSIESCWSSKFTFVWKLLSVLSTCYFFLWNCSVCRYFYFRCLHVLLFVCVGFVCVRAHARSSTWFVWSTDLLCCESRFGAELLAWDTFMHSEICTPIPLETSMSQQLSCVEILSRFDIARTVAALFFWLWCNIDCELFGTIQVNNLRDG